MINKKCPYPGLRPYHESESIYFKGRDTHVRQITKQLEERKVVMITGASGDGKSSLVYAGLIPNARAGFFQAKYNSWLFVDFKPERNPIQHLAESLSKQLNIAYESTQEKISYGFSSLVDIYKTSDYYVDENSDNWLNASIEEQKEQRNKAANLFILADQFEEFFTNNENFSAGNPSVNAYTAVNLLLETANIAIAEDLPIYIVFTMRSDFISQCVAFKGLPEMIGFSQFFVPRLKRKEIKQVIEEPALLSGGKISNRLTEVIINELRDGFDQLPVLQHAMHQLWNLAGNGEQELDLIHLAKLAGMPATYLSDDDKKVFEHWFSQLPENKKAYFGKPELKNILNSHANYLYESAFDYFNTEVRWVQSNISLSDAKLILKTVFQSLTKIDDGRAVRNRMSLREITNIIDKENINYETVCGVLNIFRLPDSTFIRPFINPDDLDTQFISATTILDITHEALIRNWELLQGWEKEEMAHVNDFKEFQIQLKRWIENNKSKQFLLASGSLLHFENWFKQCKPNHYWIAKYDDSTISQVEKYLEAEIIADNIKEFLKKSRLYLTQLENAKKRRKNIATSVALGVILTLSVLMGFAFKEKKKAEKQELLATQQSIEAQNQQQKAELSRNKAIEANTRAEDEKKRAEINAQKAIKAKALSDEARKNAESMRVLAEKNNQIAQQETQKAKLEKQRANEQRSIAEIASDSAHALSMLANAQTLAFKAQQNYSNKQLNLDYALKAYRLNNEFGGYKRDAAIYDGLLAAIQMNGFDNTIYSIPNKIISTRIDEQNNIHLYTDNNTLIQLEANTYAPKRQDNVNEAEAYSSILWPDHAFVAHENHTFSLINTTTKKTLSIDNQENYIHAASLLNNHIITASNDKKIDVWNIENETITPTHSIPLASKAISLVSGKTNFYTGLVNGCIEQYSINGYQRFLVDSLESRISAMCISNNGDYLIAATSLGTINIYQLTKSFNKNHSLSIQDIFIENLAINSKNNLLAVASSNQQITIYDMNDWQRKPLTLKMPNQQWAVKTMAFNAKDQLIVSFTNNNVKIWETSNENYATLVEKLVKKNTKKQAVNNNEDKNNSLLNSASK